MKDILVSIIITTKNEASVIGNLLKSIKEQTFPLIEVIVVDNSSIDQTKLITKEYGVFVFNKGPERSAQRNFGAKKANGEYLLFLDADMVLVSSVVKECVETIQGLAVGGVIIPEKSVGKGFWAKVKAYERSFYIDDETVEAARFYSKKKFEELGGFDQNITGPEDWDFSQRMKNTYGLGRIRSYIHHDEGNLNMFSLMKKKYYYAKSARQYLVKNNMRVFNPQTIFFLRKAFYRNPNKILFHPFLFIAMLSMLSLELLAGAFGYCLSGRVVVKKKLL